MYRILPIINDINKLIQIPLFVLHAFRSQDRVGEDRVGEDRVGEDRVGVKTYHVHQVKYFPASNP